MEEEVPGPAVSGNPEESKESVRVKRKTLRAVLDQCQRELKSLGNTQELDEGNYDEDEDGVRSSSNLSRQSSVARRDAREAYEHPLLAEEGSSWDLVSDSDLWEGENMDVDKEDYVLVMVRQEDIVEGIACFMAAYSASLKETEELTPNQLQEALSKTFLVMKEKGKLQKAWDGSKVIYNVASWGATAIGIYQSPVLFDAAGKAYLDFLPCHLEAPMKPMTSPPCAVLQTRLWVSLCDVSIPTVIL